MIPLFIANTLGLTGFEQARLRRLPAHPFSGPQMIALPHRILYQLVSPLHRSIGPAEIGRREQMLRKWTLSTVYVDVASTENGPAVIENLVDVAMVFPSLREAASRWSRDGYGTVIIGCFSDPGVDAFRELTDCVVIGPGEAAMLAALQAGHRFSVLSTMPSPSGLRRRVLAMGIDEYFVSEHSVDASVSALRQRPENAFDAILSSAMACRHDGADVLVLGCLAMCFVEGLTERLQAAIGIPVINPVIAALRAAETARTFSRAGEKTA